MDCSFKNINREKTQRCLQLIFYVNKSLSHMCSDHTPNQKRHEYLIKTYTPQIEEDVGLLVQDNLDVAGVNHGIVHLIPLPITGLETK